MNQGKYLITVICHALPCNDFGQRVLEHAVVVGNCKLTGDIDVDITQLMANYDEHCLHYRKHQLEMQADSHRHVRIPVEVGV